MKEYSFITDNIVATNIGPYTITLRLPPVAREVAGAHPKVSVLVVDFMKNVSTDIWEWTPAAGFSAGWLETLEAVAGPNTERIADQIIRLVTEQWQRWQKRRDAAAIIEEAVAEVGLTLEEAPQVTEYRGRDALVFTIGFNNLGMLTSRRIGGEND